jgi:hypothetical protein
VDVKVVDRPDVGPCEVAHAPRVEASLGDYGVAGPREFLQLPLLIASRPEHLHALEVEVPRIVWDEQRNRETAGKLLREVVVPDARACHSRTDVVVRYEEDALHDRCGPTAHLI